MLGKSTKGNSKSKGHKMIDGSKTYYLPKCDIEVEVNYSIIGESVTFQYAEINDHELECETLGVTVDTTEKHDLVRSSKQLTLKQWYQSQLDHDSGDIFKYHDINVRSEYDEHFNQRAFI